MDLERHNHRQMEALNQRSGHTLSSMIAENTKRVQARNKIAQEIVTREGIAVDYLYGLVKDHAEYWSPDGVHFNAQGIAAQAEQVTKKITEALK
ncbi:MAG: hypothetical protein NTY19_42280 [Planctomycetota bacterium]|nr:hypothetical protein [Planctomycetota bacterium]